MFVVVEVAQVLNGGINLFLSSRPVSVLEISVICIISMEQIGLMNQVSKKNV